MKSTFDHCYQHGKPYQFIGNDYNCHLNCRICYDCLRSSENNHRKGVSNHETISTQQLSVHFDKLEKYNHSSILECNQAIQKYFRSFESLLQDELQKQKERLSRIVRKILLTGVAKEEHKIEVIEKLYNRDFISLTCHDVAQVSPTLFNFVPKNNQSGFRKFIAYINQKQAQVYRDFQEITSQKVWNKTMLKDIEKQASFHHDEQKISLKVSRVRTEEGTPKKTLRRSIRKQFKKPDLKDISVQLKKPLNLQGTTLVDHRQEGIFLSRIFQPKNVLNSQLLYRASEHNFSIKEFHQLCDGQSNTLVLLRTEFNKVIGGFTTIPWKSTANTLHSDIRRQSFIFSLSLKQKMCLVDEKSAIFNSVNFGPTFGAGADLAICHNGNVQKTSYSQFPYSYGNSRYKESNQHSTALFTGQKQGNHFLLKEWEVWKITFE